MQFTSLTSRTEPRHICGRFPIIFFTLECRRALVKTSKDIAVRRYPSHLFGLYLDALPHALARNDSAQRVKATEIVKSIIHGIVPIANDMNLQHMDLMFPLHQISGCFTAPLFPGGVDS